MARPRIRLQALLINIIIICGSNAETLQNCLRSLSRQKVDFQLTLIDNATLGDTFSFDSWAQLMPGKWLLIKHKTPWSFPANNNLGLRLLPEDCDFVLFLNDDTVLADGVLSHLLTTMQGNPEIGAMGPTLYNTDGSLQSARWYFPWSWHGIATALFGSWFAFHPKPSAGDPFWQSGACLFVRTSALKQTGGMDEGYDPGYGEDTDLCYRMLRAGWKLRVCDDIGITHLGGQSFGDRGNLRHQLSLRGWLRNVAKWQPKYVQEVHRVAWAIGLSARLLLTWCCGKRLGANASPSVERYEAMLKALSRVVD